MLRRFWLAGGIALAALVLAAPGAASVRTRTSRAPQVPHFGHVFLIIGENTGASDLSKEHTPYIVGTLMPDGGTLTNYQAVHGGSLANYIAMSVGHYKSCEVNDSLPYNFNNNIPICTETGPDLFSLLDGAGISWTVWGESMPNPCGFVDTGEDWSNNVYTTHHDPAVYFDDVEGKRYGEAFERPPSPECVQRVLPMGSTAPGDTSAFDQALLSGSVPVFNMIVPNDCENGHDVCGSGFRVKQFDDFLAREVPKIFASPAFGSDGLLLVTYDEWGSVINDKRVAFVADGPLVTAGSASTLRYNHYSLLRTLEDGYGLRPYLGKAANAASITGIWTSDK